MPKFSKTIIVDADQVDFADKDKEIAKRGLPVATHGDHLRHEDGVYSVFVHLGEDGKRANEGDWIVVENGKKSIVPDEEFKKTYVPYEEAEHVVTEEVLSENPELKEARIVVGDTIGLPADPELIPESDGSGNGQ